MSGDLGETSGRLDHDRGRAHQALFQGLNRGQVRGVAHSRVVAVDYEDFVGGFVAEAFG
jgi:hypothetical protein